MVVGKGRSPTDALGVPGGGHMTPQGRMAMWQPWNLIDLVGIPMIDRFRVQPKGGNVRSGSGQGVCHSCCLQFTAFVPISGFDPWAAIAPTFDPAASMSKI